MRRFEQETVTIIGAAQGIGRAAEESVIENFATEGSRVATRQINPGADAPAPSGAA